MQFEPDVLIYIHSCGPSIFPITMSLTNQKNLKIRFDLDQHFQLLSCFKMTKLKTSENSKSFKEKKSSLQRQKLRTLLYSDQINLISDERNDDDYNLNDNSARKSSASDPSTRYPNVSSSPAPSSGTASPYYLSPWNQPSPYTKSPWIHQQFPTIDQSSESLNNGLVGSLIREEGHVYSLATCGDLLYTGSDSKNIRVWKNLKDFSGFKSNSGLVKAIVALNDKIFTGHQDGKIRVWKLSGLRKNGYKRIGSLPTTKEFLKKSINPTSYVQVRRHHNVPWIKHFDAISCMAVDVAGGLLYSASWDKTLKVWRLSDSKCIESITAHDDAVNSVVVGFDGLIFTGSADGTVKAWRRELVGKSTQHVLVDTLLTQESAVTSLAVNGEAAAVYAGSSDGLVNFWEREKHFISHGGLLRGHKLAVLCLAAAGNLVFSGSADKSICVWRREEGGIHTCLSVLTGHSGPVKCLAVEEGDGDDDDCDQRWRLYSGSLDKSVMVWSVSENATNEDKLEGI